MTTSECKTTEDYSLHYRSSTMISIGSFKSASVLCDVKIEVAGQEMPAHRLVLASRSKYFQGLFLPKNNEFNGKVELRDLDPKAVKQCIEFIYGGHITVSLGTVESILRAACLMELEELCKWIFAFLQSRIDGKSCLNTKRLANTYNNPKLEEVCDDYAVTHFKDIAMTEDFKKVDKDYLTTLVMSHDVQQSLSPAVIYESIVTWVKADIRNREGYFPELLAYIKLHKLSPEYLKETVQKEALVKESKVCLEMLVNVLFGQISNSPSSSPSSTLKSNSGSRPSKSSKPRQEKAPANSANDKSQQDANACMALIVFDDSVEAIKAYKPSTNQWLQMQALPKDLDTFAAVVLEKYIYILARSNQSLYRIEYATKSATWTQVTGRIVNDACLLQLVVEDGYIFIIGDVSATRRNSNQSGVIRYGPSANTWEHLASLKTPRRGHSVAAVNGSLYCIGGSNGRQDLNSVEKLDPTVGSWASVAPLHHVRYESASVVYNRKIYVVGGGKFMDMVAGGKNLRTDAEFYDPFSNQWTVVSNVKFPRHIRCACSVDGCIVVVAADESNTTGKGGVHNIAMIDLENSQMNVIAKGLKIKPTCLAIYAK